MADYLDEDEQIEVIKKWWEENGKKLLIIMGVSLSFLAVFQFFGNKKQAYIDESGSKYHELINVDANSGNFNSLVNELKSDYPKSTYAHYASMLAAKNAINKEQFSKAEEALTWVVDRSKDDVTVDLATMRLIQVKYTQKQYDEALALIKKEDESIYSFKLYEIKGDILLAQNDQDAAIDAYKKAKEISQKGEVMSPLLDFKLLNLGVAVN